jgi:2-oxo-4-hydroxy-4-carboxy-5-ureidoimidazoline decarboxylase
MTLVDINRMEQDAFVATLGGIVEHSPWVADSAWERRPFVSADTLHAAMMEALGSAPREKKIALLRAHPELAGKLALRGELTRDSAIEQSGAGLTHCSPQELSELIALNKAYSSKFGFPFIIAVKGLDRSDIIDRFHTRLRNDDATEFREALDQVARISRLRLAALLET